MQVTRVTTAYHQHLVATPVAQESSTRLHVYIEGDGRPWIKRFQIAKDPSPRSPLVLRLMHIDPNPSLFLGRPCYFNYVEYGLSDAACDADKWTSERYSQEIVASMVSALRQALIARDQNQLVLIGYSGGGTLAMLMAQQMPEVDRLITIAANLDIDAWTHHHHYTPLSKSMNPAHIDRAHPADQIHLVGNKDEVVTPELNRNFLQRIQQPLIVMEGFDHRCCWEEKWPELLQLFDEI